MTGQMGAGGGGSMAPAKPKLINVPAIVSSWAANRSVRVAVHILFGPMAAEFEGCILSRPGNGGIIAYPGTRPRKSCSIPVRADRHDAAVLPVGQLGHLDRSQMGDAVGQYGIVIEQVPFILIPANRMMVVQPTTGVRICPR